MVAHVIQLEATVEDVMPKVMTGFLMPVTVPTNLTVLTVSMVSATIKSTSTVMPFSTKCSASLMMNVSIFSFFCLVGKLKSLQQKDRTLKTDFKQ